MQRLYLDTCCLNRPFDDQTQIRIRLESEAILHIIKQSGSGQWRWIKSRAVDIEIAQTPDFARRNHVAIIASFAHESVKIEAEVVERALSLQSIGFQGFDALHLACAEQAGADVLLTTR